MTGVTPNGIRHPDGASKAKDLGFELAQMAGDMDRFIDESIDASSPVFREEAREAADEAVDAKVAQLAIVTSNDLPTVAGGPAMSIPFEKGGRRYRTAMEVDDHGRPTAFALERTAAAEEQHRLLGRTLGVETRTDVRLPGASAVFVYEGTRQIAGVVGLNGIQLGGSTATSDATDVARGDSTSASADIADPARDGWFAVLMRMIDCAGINWGRSGARAEEITFMGGGLWITGTPNGNTIPASGAVEITGLSVDPWRAGVTRPVPVMAVTATGLSVPGTLERIDNGNTSTRVFVRKTDGAPIAATSIRFRGNPADKGRRLYVGMGINNEPLIESGSQTIQDIQRWYRAITRGHTGPLIVWGLLDRGVSEKPGTVRGDYIRAMETWLAAEYGAAWCPVRQYLASPAALTDAAAFTGYVPTQADQDHVAAGVVPPGFRTGGGTSVHLNELGNWLQAWFIFNYLIERGLI